MRRELERHAERMRIFVNGAPTPLPQQEIRAVIEKVADLHGVPVDYLRDTSMRERQIVIARREAIVKLAAKGYSIKVIGRSLGGMHHASIYYALGLTKKRPWVQPLMTSEAPVPDLSGEWAI